MTASEELFVTGSEVAILPFIKTVSRELDPTGEDFCMAMCAHCPRGILTFGQRPCGSRGAE